MLGNKTKSMNLVHCGLMTDWDLIYCCPIKPLHAALLSLNAAEILMISSNFQFQAPLE